MTRVSNPSMGRGNTSVTTKVLGVSGSGRPSISPMTSMGLPPFFNPFSTPEWQCISIFMTAEGLKAADWKYLGSFCHGADERREERRASSKV